MIARPLKHTHRFSVFHPVPSILTTGQKSDRKINFSVRCQTWDVARRTSKSN